MPKERVYQFGESTLTLRFGDITGTDAQVIVSSDDSYITMGGGVSAAILRAGGEAIALDASKKVPAALGDIVVTTAGALSAQYVFHAITLGNNPEHLTARAIVERATRRCMQMLDNLQLSSIAFPAIGSGAARLGYEDVASTMAEVIVDCLSRRKSPAAATIYLLDRYGRMSEMDFIRFFEEFAARSPKIGASAVDVGSTQLATKESFVDLATETEDEYKRRRLHSLRRLLVELDEQRSRLEQELIGLLGIGSDDKERRVRQALKDNQELRLQYLGELRSFSAALADETPLARPSGQQTIKTVFVSSTYVDLVAYRAQVKDALSRLDLLFRGMEHFGAAPDVAPAAAIVEEVRKADAYVGIFGVRYGSIDPATGLSMTELEFREAEAAKKPMLLYVMHAEAPVAAGLVETNPGGQAKLSALKAHILSHHLVYMFKNVDDLGRQVVLDLPKLRASRQTA